MAQGTTARKPVGQQVAFMRKLLTVGSLGNQTVTIGTLPAGASILRCTTMVRSAYTGGTPTISFGTSGSVAAFVAATGALATGLGRNVGTLVAAAAQYQTADTAIVAAVGGVPSGGGDADAEVEYTTPDETP